MFKTVMQEPVVPQPVEGVTVRFADEEDAETMLGFIRELAEYEKLADEVVTNKETLAQNLFGPQPYAECLIAESNGQPAGFAVFFHTFSTFAGKPGLYLEDLYVKPEFRKTGIGFQLMQELAHIVLERDCVRIEWRVLDWNIPGIIFYRKFGAKPLNNWITQQLEREQIEQLAEEEFG